MKTARIMFGVAIALLLVSCQSAPKPAPVETPAPVVKAPEPEPVVETPAPVVPAPVVVPDQIEVSRDGFSPLAAPPNHTITVRFKWSDPSKMVEWALLFVSDSGTAVRTIRGTDALPFVDWDGKTDAGVLAPQARYQAVLQTAGSDGVLTEKARTVSFLLDIVPPSGTITVNPVPFVLGPADVIVNPPQTVTIHLNLVSGASPWTTWRLAVIHPDGRRFRDFINEDHRDNQVVWDGRAINNSRLEAGVTYKLEAEVYDVYGNRGLVSTTLPVQAPPAPEPVAAPKPAPAPEPEVTTVKVTLDGRVLAELPIFFPPYSADFSLLKSPQKEQNEQALQKLADLLLSAPDTQVKIVGHANQVLYEDPVKAAYEQRETLIPLSKARADAVQAALISAGVSPDSLTTEGVGAADPVAPFSDAENRWKNRRVILEVQPKP